LNTARDDTFAPTHDRPALAESARARRLQDSDAAARRRDALPPDAAVQACPFAPLHAIEVRVIGEDDGPLADITVELQNTARQAVRDRTDPDGMVRFAGLAAGGYRLSLVELDKDAWQREDAEALDSGRPQPPPPWGAPLASARTADFTHTVVQGECVAKLGDRYGLFVDTVWHWPANAALRARRANPYVLLPGDEVVIPPLRAASIDAAVDTRYVLRRRGVPEQLDLQFMLADRPRANVPYVLSLRTLSGAVLPDVRGKTSSDGRLRGWLPPDACRATVVLTEGDLTSEYHVSLGGMDPSAEDSGIDAILENLGYYDADPLNGHVRGPADALRAFQRDHDLPVSGRLDVETRRSLRRRGGVEPEAAE
jgi:uncharacterized lipoprotein YbaY